jgi:senataxin
MQEEVMKVKLKSDKEFERSSFESEKDDSKWKGLLDHQDSLKSELESLRKDEREGGKPDKELSAIRTKIKRICDRLKDCDENIKELKRKRTELDSTSDAIKARIKLKILTQSEIIMSTLSGAGHEILSSIHGVEFPTVIIDEACQAVELSGLIPLRYNVTKCIMVGGMNLKISQFISAKGFFLLRSQAIASYGCVASGSEIQIRTKFVSEDYAVLWK